MESLNVDLFVVSLVTPMPIDLEPRIEVLSLFLGGPEYFMGYLDIIGLV